MNTDGASDQLGHRKPSFFAPWTFCSMARCGCCFRACAHQQYIHLPWISGPPQQCLCRQTLSTALDAIQLYMMGLLCRQSDISMWSVMSQTLKPAEIKSDGNWQQCAACSYIMRSDLHACAQIRRIVGCVLPQICQRLIIISPANVCSG